MTDTPPKRFRFTFASCNEVWGGSEELWSRAAAVLAERGHAVTLYKNRLDTRVPILGRLRSLGCRFIEFWKLPLAPASLENALAGSVSGLLRRLGARRLRRDLLRDRPDLVIVSQGANHDGWWLARVCQSLGLPLALISQYASDNDWPSDGRRAMLRAAYGDAVQCFFVSEANQRLTEEQLGLRLERASVVRNPFNVSWDVGYDWPDGGALRLACVGRLHPEHKGQDILLRVLASPKWRARPVSLTLFGKGGRAEGLQGLATLLGLQNVTFAGHCEDVAEIWRNHHCLALPSRGEGMPLVLVEAMLCGRVPIVTRVAGNPELVEDGVTGFLADAATEEAFDSALERAWQRRETLSAIGNSAAARIRALVPPDPAAVFADRLVELADASRARNGGLPGDRR